MDEKGILAVIGGLILREIISAIVSYVKSRNSTIDELKEALSQNTYELKSIRSNLEELTRLKRDVDSLFEWKRSIK